MSETRIKFRPVRELTELEKKDDLFFHPDAHPNPKRLEQIRREATKKLPSTNKIAFAFSKKPETNVPVIVDTANQDLTSQSYKKR